MRALISKRSFVLASLCVASAIALGSSCESPRPEECLVAEQCLDFEWRTTDCDESVGHWECLARQCVGICPECELDADCESRGWDGPCDAIDGHWECNAGLCEAVCAGADCTTEADCTGATWDLPCAGRWSCEGQQCVSICDHTNCGDGSCDASIGEDAESCVPDCAGGCTTSADCLGESWLEICQGSWSCNFLAGGTCEENCSAPLCGNAICEPELGEGANCPDCSAQLCSVDAECDALPLPGGCTGEWSCAWVVCMAICE